MTDRLKVTRHQEEDRWIRGGYITGGQVTDVTEEDFETTEGESVDFYDKLKVVSSYGQCNCVGHGV
jgi:hypothetical protein